MNHNNCRITVPEIPVFFSTDDNYIPFLDVALSSLIENASRDYRYRIMILNTGLSAENMARILEREQAGVSVKGLFDYFFEVKSGGEDNNDGGDGNG